MCSFGWGLLFGFVWLCVCFFMLRGFGVYCCIWELILVVVLVCCCEVVVYCLPITVDFELPVELLAFR